MRHIAVLAAGLAVLPAVAMAAAPAPHLRGEVTAVQGDSVTLRTDDGSSKTVTLTGTTRFVEVRKSSLSAIDKNSFIGTATKDVGSKLVALEVVVFPDAMRGTGEGHYDWDPLPDTTLGGGKVSSSMTNGTVAASSAAGGKVASTMTNGTVSMEAAQGGARMLTVTYKGGEQQIMVPPNVPVVTLAPGTRDEIKQGSQVVVTTAKDSDTAASVAIGVDGVKPPM